MNKKIFILTILFFSFIAITQIFCGNADINILVTPGSVSTTLSISTNSYNFGTLDLQTSSNSATAVTLTNTGNVGVSLQKTINYISEGITLTNDNPSSTDQFRLRCVSKSTRADLNTDFSVVHTTFSTTVGTYNNLTDTSGNQVILNPSDSSNVWFQIDLPPSVSNSSQRTFTVRFQSTAQ